MTYKYKTKGTCSREIVVDVENGIGGCDGNLKGISSIVKGMKIDDVIDKLKGIKCANKITSCPDQLSKALEEAKENI
mgnify:CR=1 FL=1